MKSHNLLINFKTLLSTCPVSKPVLGSVGATAGTETARALPSYDSQSSGDRDLSPVRDNLKWTQLGESMELGDPSWAPKLIWESGNTSWRWNN